MVDARARAYAAAAAVLDPELPPLTIADLGILRDVTVSPDGGITIAITPTYSGCPATAMIALEIEIALIQAGLPAPRIQTVLSPAWTTDWMTPAARDKLRAIGIAPPTPTDAAPACPLCLSADTERLSEFGSTACKSLWRCRACREPFDHFKCH
jgi:ring-1,2-phenylacetyl-CoA epoxidase subunit PaaD